MAGNGEIIEFRRMETVSVDNGSRPMRIPFAGEEVVRLAALRMADDGSVNAK
ncbi:hypothetical protein [Bifidobacterium avesanii]|uniref:hypothetical protein n=1 Tax=Bifidobacterium avesanii TaxID=1798157 RepID=UPI0013D78C53|nr:hypothetical protein [Bifidobacterium avesanii]